MVRKEQYSVSGELLDGRKFAHTVTPSYVAFLGRSSSPVIPPQYFVATAQHESNFASNEVDTEVSGYISKGLYQLSDDEAAQVGMKGANLLDPVVSTIVFARIQERRLNAIKMHCPGSFVPDDHHISDTSLLPFDVWGYLAVAHNEGLGRFTRDGKGALGTIYNYGLRWGNPLVPALEDAINTYRKRNASRPIVRYGDDCITGGERWGEVVRG